MSARTTTNAVSSSAKRSWRRFTLRALFLTVLAVGVFFSWVAHRVRQFHEQATFIADPHERGFRIETEPVTNEWFWRPLAGNDAVQVKIAILRSHRRDTGFVGPTRDDLNRIGGWTEIIGIWLHGNSVTDETLVVIGNFRELQNLMLFDTAISDAALQHLNRLPNLTHLRIVNETADNEHSHASFTTAAAQHIARSQDLQFLYLYGVPMDKGGLQLISTNLPELRELSLVNCNLTDDCLAGLKRLAKLTQLRISQNTNVTDDGLRHLFGLKSLKFLDATETQVSREGSQELRAHIPTLLRQRTWTKETRLW